MAACRRRDCWVDSRPQSLRLPRHPRFQLQPSSRFPLNRPLARGRRRRRLLLRHRKMWFDRRYSPHLLDWRMSRLCPLWFGHRWPPHRLSWRKSFPLRTALKKGLCWLFRLHGPRCLSSWQRWRLRSTRFLRFLSCRPVQPCRRQIHLGSRWAPCCCRQGRSRTRTGSRLVWCSWT
jgi:hypothetical protein